MNVISKRGLRYTFPDGMTEAQMASAIAQEEEQGIAGGTLDAFTTGAVMGFGDEATAAESAILGREPGGGTFDLFNYSRPYSERYDAALRAERDQNKDFATDHPFIAAGAEVAGGITGSMLPGGAIGAGGKMLPRVLAGSGYGFTSGYGQGEGGVGNRLEMGAISFPFAAAGASISPYIAKQVPRLSGLLSKHLRAQFLGGDPLEKVAKEIGATPQATRVVSDYVDQDRVWNESPRVLGPNDSLLNVGEGMTGLGRTVLNTAAGRGSPGPGRVNARANWAAKEIREAMDESFGTGSSPEALVAANAKLTRAGRSAAYNEVFDGPQRIDYDDPGISGLVDDVLDRIPDDDLAGAVALANRLMIPEVGKKNMWSGMRMIEVVENADGTVNLTRRPDMRQLDMIKRALQQKHDEALGDFGAETPLSVHYGNMARSIRRTALGVSPRSEGGDNLYQVALDLGHDKLAVQQAVKLGDTLMSPSVTRAQVKTATDGMAVAERTAGLRALRQRIDEMQANVGPTRSMDDAETQEAYRLLKEWGKRAFKEKVQMLLGDDQLAEEFIARMDPAIQALKVRASVAMRSDTAPNLQTLSGATAGSPKPLPTNVSVIGAINQGRNLMSGQTPTAIARAEAADLSSMSDLLTRPGGGDLYKRLVAAQAKQNKVGQQGALSKLLQEMTLKGGARGASNAVQPLLPEPGQRRSYLAR